MIPEFTGTYYEPFLGTGAVYLHLLPKKAVLNDLNEDIINIWKLVKTNPDYIIQEIEKFKKKFLHLNNQEKIIILNKSIKNVKIENKDYSEILKNTKPGDFVFLDPPYIEEKTYAFNYNKNEIFDIQKLKRELEKLDKKKVKWMMTQIDTFQVRELFKDCRFSSYTSNITFGGSPKLKKEVIITNY